MNKIFTFVSTLAIFAVTNTSAQPWLKNMPQKETSNFFAIQKAFNDYWKDKEPGKQENENEADGGYQQFKRWENFMAPRVDASGNFDPTILYREYSKYKRTARAPQSVVPTANWTQIGPTTVPINGGGAGRINVVEFDPNTPTTMWVGAANGGLWKSTNGGTTWSSNTDLLPSISIADIAIDPINTNNMYLATGDGYGYEVGTFWGGTYSAGVLKSTDGGATWDTTGLTYTQMQNNIIQRVIVHPTNPTVVLAAARDGIWKSVDAGATWTNTHASHIFDLEFNTANPAIVYAASESAILKSVDTGSTWTTLPSGIPSFNQRVSLAVTPANPNVIYLLITDSGGSGNVYESTNAGASFSLIGPGDNGYGYYNNVISVSPVDENTLYTSGLDVSKSTDGGVTWNVVSGWYDWPMSTYVHADGHDVKFLPGSGSTIFACNDGGIFKTTDAALTWNDLSSNISIAQYYRLSCSATNPNYIFAGQQDNGCVRYSSGIWKMVLLADGMEQLVDYTDPNIVYSAIQNGAISKSTNGGNTYTDVSPSSYGDWITPFVIDPGNHDVLYAGCEDVYESYDGGNGWTPISFNITGSTSTLLSSLAVAPSNNLYIYTSTAHNIWMTPDGGGTWNDITGTLPVSTSTIMYIAVSNNNPKKLWITLSGYTNGDKVFKSTNAGATWTNVSGTLPNIPVNCITYQKNSPDILYIGTDFGVFMRDSLMTDWIPYTTGLPNVVVDELEIQYGVGKLRAATYGRGLWETPIYNPTGIAENELEQYSFVYPNPSNGNFTVQSTAIKMIEVYNVLGEKIYETKVNGFTNSVDIDISNQATGIYIVKIQTEKGIVNRKINLTE